MVTIFSFGNARIGGLWYDAGSSTEVLPDYAHLLPFYSPAHLLFRAGTSIIDIGGKTYLLLLARDGRNA